MQTLKVFYDDMRGGIMYNDVISNKKKATINGFKILNHSSNCYNIFHNSEENVNSQWHGFLKKLATFLRHSHSGHDSIT